ncbi:MAG TPA: hypothetical protein VGM51_08625 [Armatimonadota bacterium]|jgi:hypothetical protein
MSEDIPPGWEKVWQILDSAFDIVAPSHKSLEQHVHNHDYLAEMRFHIWDMSDDEYQFTLPWILKDLVTYHTPDPVDNAGGDEVLWSIQPWGDDPSIQSRTLERLELFDRRQVVAILAWLEMARRLPGFSLSEDEINSAYTFWKTKLALRPLDDIE